MVQQRLTTPRDAILKRKTVTLLTLLAVVFGLAAGSCLITPDSGGHVAIPDTITFIRNYGFNGCGALRSVTIADTVTFIGIAGFRSSSLVNVNVPGSVSYIQNHAFYGCQLLETVTLTPPLVSLGAGVFALCPRLMSVFLPTSVTIVPAGTLPSCLGYGLLLSNAAANNQRGLVRCVPCFNLSTFTVPDTVASIGGFAFPPVCNTARVTSIVMPDSVTTILVNAVPVNMLSVTTITLSNALTMIPASMCHQATSLGSIDIPNSVTAIGGGAFYGCSSLRSINIPAAATLLGGIGGSAFSLCGCHVSLYVAGATFCRCAPGSCVTTTASPTSPTFAPTRAPSLAPTAPTPTPTATPTTRPPASPTRAPQARPTSRPVPAPAAQPTQTPVTLAPSAITTAAPAVATLAPSATTTAAPVGGVTPGPTGSTAVPITSAPTASSPTVNPARPSASSPPSSVSPTGRVVASNPTVPTPAPPTVVTSPVIVHQTTGSSSDTHVLILAAIAVVALLVVVVFLARLVERSQNLQNQPVASQLQDQPAVTGAPRGAASVLVNPMYESPPMTTDSAGKYDTPVLATENAPRNAQPNESEYNTLFQAGMYGEASSHHGNAQDSHDPTTSSADQSAPTGGYGF